MKKLLTILTAALASVIAVNAQVVTDEAKQKAAQLLSQMTLQEKLEYIGGYEAFYIRAIDRLGIPAIRMADGPQGVRNNTKSTLYTSGIATASTWNRDLVYEMGTGLGMDCRARGVHIILGPGVNIYRSPLCGRNFEYFGEDPYLAGETAAAYIKGVQSQGVMACIKHFCANNQEYERHHVSTDVDERTLHEIYLPAFRKAVQDAGVGAVMGSYNMINGMHASENPYTNIEVLRNMWGFDGIYMSDWTSTYSTMGTAIFGLDLEMPRGMFMNPKDLKPLIKSGVVDEKQIDIKVQHILQTLISFGFFDRPQKDESIPEDNETTKQIALNLARESAVLLKNEDGLLPLKKGKIFIAGPHADMIPTGGGSGFVTPSRTCSILEGFNGIKGIKTVDLSDMYKYSLENMFYTDSSLSTRGLTAEYFAEKTPNGKALLKRTATEIKHNWGNRAPAKGVPQDGFSIRWSGVMCSKTDFSYSFILSGDDGYRMFIDGKEIMSDWNNHGTTSRICSFRGEAGKKYDIRIEYYDNAMQACVEFKYVDLDNLTGGRDKELAKADAVVLCMGFDSDNEKENSDRTFELPAGQPEMINAFARLNPNIVVVMNGGGAFETESWIGNVKALLMAWYPGQEGGRAVAEIITGKISPSGRLPISMERRWEDNPTYDSYFPKPDNVTPRKQSFRRVTYSEGVFMGYRGYERNNTTTLYPFGYGLTYSTFSYGNLSVDKNADGVVVSFDVTNSGKTDAAEVAQVYVGELSPLVPRPVKELKGYEKVFLRKGESKRVEVVLTDEAFAYFDTTAHGFKVNPAGEFKIFVGASVEDVRLTETIKR